MARAFALPDLGEGLVEAAVVRVLVAEGDTVARDAPLLEVETDKAQVELPSPWAGRVERIHVSPGQVVTVGEPLISFADGGGAPSPAESTSTASAAPPAPELPSAPAPSRAPGAGASPAGDIAPPVDRPAGSMPSAAPSPMPPATPAAPRTAGPVPATPATRRLARELGVDLRSVTGRGRGGRVTDEDVRAAASAQAGRDLPSSGPARAGTAERSAPPAASAEAPRAPGRPLRAVGIEAPPLPRFEQWGPIEREPLSHLRRTIAERMTLSATLVPHVTHFDRADVTELGAVIRRNQDEARARGGALTLTAFLLKAAALALGEHPRFNASLDAAAGELVLKRYCHLGVAVATSRGLIVPVLRDVDRKPVLEVARELGILAERTRDGHVGLEDLQGGTFTVTNIGALGGTGAIPIINYPEVAILAVARAREEPAIHEGQIAPRLLLPLSVTFDHRVADGADGARFAAAIVRRLERPDHLLLGF